MAAGAMVKTALTGSGLLGDVLNVVGGVADYNRAREEGDSKAVSLGKAAGSFIWGEMLFGGASSAIGKSVSALGLGGGWAVAGNIAFMGAYMGISVGASLATANGQHNARTMSQAYRRAGKLGSGYFNMTEAGYTMRQRSLNAIRQNGLNTQSVLGNEARTYYRGTV